MAFITTQQNMMLKTIDSDEDDEEYECLGCETGVDYVGAHLNKNGRYNKDCCTREAEKERNMLRKLNGNN